MKYSRGGFLSKHLVVVAVIFIKTALKFEGRLYWFWNEHLHGLY